jgi:hypothetical protein
VRVARDTVYAPGNVALARTTVVGLQGAIMEQTDASISRPYAVTFQPGSATTFSNKIEIIVEEANTGLERHKYFSDRAAFAECAAAASSSPEQSVSPATGSPEQSVAAAVGSPAPSFPNTSAGSDQVGGQAVTTLEILFVASLIGLAGSAVIARRRRYR